MSSIYIVKDENGNEVNKILADKDFMERNYDYFEAYVPPVVEPTAEELAQEARAWRDQELKETDALAILPDYPNATALTTYRQALRDWPASESFPDTRPTLGA